MQTSSTQSIAILAGGCFWGMEEILRQMPGVLATRVGYTGGQLNNPRYDDVKRGETGHAEAIEILYDAAKLDFAAILRLFFRMHNPTTRNRQGNDVGSQYRSAIFYRDPEQKRIAEEIRAEVDRSGKWSAPVVTEITAAGSFWSAEEEHQAYLQKHPGGYTCHFIRD